MNTVAHDIASTQPAAPERTHPAPVTTIASARPPAGKPVVDKVAAAAVKKARHEAEAMWRPAHSTPYWEHTLRLATDKAEYVYHMALVKAQQSLYFFYHTLPDNVDAVGAAEKLISDKFDVIENALTDELARIQVMANSIAAAPAAGYTGGFEVKVAMYTPEAMRFARLLTTYDDLVRALDSLWFAAHINRKVRSQIVQQYRNVLIAFAREIYINSRKAKNAVRDDRMMRDTQRIAKAADKANGRRSAPEPEATEIAPPADAAPAETTAKAKRTTPKAAAVTAEAAVA